MQISRNQRSLLIAVLLSILLIHIPLFILIWRYGDRVVADSRLASEKKNAVFVNLKQKELPIVDIAKPAQEEVPDTASAQGLYNSKVLEETTASGLKPQTTSGPVVKRPSVAKPDQLKSPLTQKTATSKKPPPPKSLRHTQPSQAKTPLAKAPEIKAPPIVMPSQKPSLQDELRALQNQQQIKEASNLKKFASNFTPPTNFGGSGGGEYLPDYKVGNTTYVNALANPQVAYYVELKRKFKLAWNPVPALRAQINQITKGKVSVVLGVSLDANGKLSELRILKGSGLSAYDAEARRTVTASAPFSQPPSHILQNDGQIHMAWTFVVYL